MELSKTQFVIPLAAARVALANMEHVYSWRPSGGGGGPRDMPERATLTTDENGTTLTFWHALVADQRNAWVLLRGDYTYVYDLADGGVRIILPVDSEGDERVYDVVPMAKPLYFAIGRLHGDEWVTDVYASPDEPKQEFDGAPCTVYQIARTWRGTTHVDQYD